MSLDAHLEVAQGDFRLGLDLRAEPGAPLAILGPNGAGKSTILRLLAGTTSLDQGRISVGQRVLDEPATSTWVPPEQRGVGLVHQDLLLFPHLSVEDNVAFGLRCRGATRTAARATARSWLDRFGVGEFARARVDDLSGGQAQRVALARALAVDPAVLLLDEPLSALDAGTRQTTRRDLRQWLGEFAGIAVVVTHDPLDALTLADQVLVVEAGQTTQAGSIAEVAARPRTRYVADLLGTNLLSGVATDRSVRVGDATVAVADVASGPVFVTIAPRSVTVHATEPTGSARNRWPATVAAIDLHGDRVRVHTVGPVPLIAEITPEALLSLSISVGGQVWLAVKATEVTTYLR